MAPATFNVGHWVRTEYERRYNCVEMRRSINWRKFGSNLIKLRPQDEKSILTEVEAWVHLLSHRYPVANPNRLQGTVRSVREETLEEWVYRLYLEQGFTNVGFKGFSKFIDLLEDMNPFEEDDIFDVVQK